MSAPILAYPQFYGKPFVLDTDFSVDPGAIGGVLSQEQDGQERVRLRGPKTSALQSELCFNERRIISCYFLFTVL